MHVLIVDDSTLLADMLRFVLEHEGHSATIVDQRFARLLDPAHPAWAGVDVVICDLNLGENLTGLDVLRVAATHHPTVRRIVLSGTDTGLVTQAQAVADVVFVKPCPLDELLARLR